MLRLPPSTSPLGLGLGVALLVPVTAMASPNESSTSESSDIDQVAQHGDRIALDTPPSGFVQTHAVSRIIYMNRCIGDCKVYKGTVNDARTSTSTVPRGSLSEYVVSEYRNAAGEIGTAADPEWNELVQCIREVYSPYNVEITDAEPMAGLSYHMAIVAGVAEEVMQDSNVLGVAPVASDCSAQDNVISFSFANAHGMSNRVLQLCWTVAQESAHAFGLDHSWSFLPDDRPACNDPMTYRTDCGGQKFYRNESARCGETAPRQCKCGATQNSHLKLLGVFGAGTPITGLPTSVLTLPVPGPGTGGNQLDPVVAGQAGSRRGIAKVELWINGFKWGEVGGAEFRDLGQPNPSDYTIPVPTDLPRSIVDVKIRAYDDIGAYTESQTVTATKGEACINDESCSSKPGMRCADGRCLWDPPVGEIGDDCTYPQYCHSMLCQGTAERQICTQQCIVGADDSCPNGFDCFPTGGGGGVCFFPDEGGCCSVADRSPWAPWTHFGMAGALLALLFRRKRRG
jgi:hypothetical protein